jgi:hypothetical protein
MSVSTLFVPNDFTLYCKELNGDISGSADTIHVTSTNNSTNSATGALTVLGGAGIGKDLFVGGNVYAANISGTSHTLTLDGTIDSTSPSTGTLIVNGGAGIAQSLFVGENVDVGGSIITNYLAADGIDFPDISNMNDVNINSTTQSTNTLTGALIVKGGVGIQGNLNIHGNTYIQGMLDTKGITYEQIQYVLSTDNATSTNSGALICVGGTGIGKDLFVGGTAKLIQGQESTDMFSGDLIVSGGITVAKKARFGGTVILNQATQSTSLLTGDMVVAGGVAVGGNMRTGQNYFVDNSNVYGCVDLNINGSQTNGALFSVINGMTLYNMTGTSTTNITMHTTLPTSYSSGTPIILRLHFFTATVAAGNINLIPSYTMMPKIGNSIPTSLTVLPTMATANNTTNQYAHLYCQTALPSSSNVDQIIFINIQRNSGDTYGAACYMLEAQLWYVIDKLGSQIITPS